MKRDDCLLIHCVEGEIAKPQQPCTSKLTKAHRDSADCSLRTIVATKWRWLLLQPRSMWVLCESLV